MPAVLTSAGCHRACCAAPKSLQSASPDLLLFLARASAQPCAPIHLRRSPTAARAALVLQPRSRSKLPPKQLSQLIRRTITFTCLTSSPLHSIPPPICPFTSPAPPLHELHSTADGGRAKQHPNDRGNHAASRGSYCALRMLRGPTARAVRVVPAHAAQFMCACPYRSMLMA